MGGTLTDSGARENFVSEQGAAHYAELYRKDALSGGHVVMLGPGNEAEARAALAAFPGGFHVGGGITPDSAQNWLDAGASHVIVTSYLFEGRELSRERLAKLRSVVPRERLVIDLSCRRVGEEFRVATNRWQTVTDQVVNVALLQALAQECSEFLVHGADVEGLCSGIEADLVRLLGQASPLPVTYAGGARDISDLDLVKELSGGRVDLTFGSSLDLFGGTRVRYADCVAYNRQALAERAQGAQG